MPETFLFTVFGLTAVTDTTNAETLASSAHWHKDINAGRARNVYFRFLRVQTVGVNLAGAVL